MFQNIHREGFGGGDAAGQGRHARPLGDFQNLPDGTGGHGFGTARKELDEISLHNSGYRQWENQAREMECRESDQFQL